MRPLTCHPFISSVAGVAALLPVLSGCASQQKEAAKQYNIVYIMTDDHTAQMMSCYDTRYVETPNLDRIANDGVRIGKFFRDREITIIRDSSPWKMIPFRKKVI